VVEPSPLAEVAAATAEATPPIPLPAAHA
jgi:hypothetical protein